MAMSFSELVGHLSDLGVISPAGGQPKPASDARPKHVTEMNPAELIAFERSHGLYGGFADMSDARRFDYLARQKIRGAFWGTMQAASVRRDLIAGKHVRDMTKAEIAAFEQTHGIRR